MTKKPTKTTKVVKYKPPMKDVALGDTGWSGGVGDASSKGISADQAVYPDLASILAKWESEATTPTGTPGTPNQNEPTASASLITQTGEVADSDLPVEATQLATLEDGLDYTPDDVDIPADAARTSILNATRSLAEYNFRRAEQALSLASIYGASRGTIAKYIELITKLGKDIEAGIVAGEHEYLQGKIAGEQIKANLVSGTTPSRASVMNAVMVERMKAHVSNSEHIQEKYVRNANAETQVSMSDADNASKIRTSYNSFLASVFGSETSANRGLASILSSAISQMGEPGISWVYIY